MGKTACSQCRGCVWARSPWHSKNSPQVQWPPSLKSPQQPLLWGTLQGPGAEPPSCTLASESVRPRLLPGGMRCPPSGGRVPQIRPQGTASPESLPGPPGSASPHGTTRHELSFDTHVVTDSVTHPFIHCSKFSSEIACSPPSRDMLAVSRVVGTPALELPFREGPARMKDSGLLPSFCAFSSFSLSLALSLPLRAPAPCLSSFLNFHS